MISAEKLRTIDINVLRNLNTAICAEIRFRNTQRQSQAAMQFRVGQVVQFENRNGGMTQIRISRINTKTLTGREVNGPREWRVSPTLCRTV